MIQNLEKNKNCFVRLISSQEQPPRNKSIFYKFHKSGGPRRSVSCGFATCFGTIARGVRGKRGVSAVNSLSVSYTGWVGVQIWGGQKLQRWHDEGPRGYTVTPAPSSFSPERRVNSERSRVCVCVCADLCFLSGVCLLWCSHSGSLPLTSLKREWCPLPATLRHASRVSGEKGLIIYYLFPSC